MAKSNNVRVEQLNMFSPRIERKPSRYYKDLTIHEKINMKCNTFGFATNCLRQGKRGWATMHPIHRSDKVEMIDWKGLRWYLDHNKKSHQTLLWRKYRCSDKEIKQILINEYELNFPKP